MSSPAIRRAPAIAAKVEAARTVLHELERDVGHAALEAAEGQSGASRHLTDLRARISNAERDVAELEKAYALAASLDRQSDAAGAAKMQAEQFAVMKQRAKVRLECVATMMDAIATASSAYSRYAVATNEMVVALPSGCHMPFVAVGRNGYGGSWIGDLKNLIAAEAWRLVVVDEHGRGARLPFSQQPELTSDDPGAFRPAIELMTEAQAAVIGDVEQQLARLNEQQMALASAEAA